MNLALLHAIEQSLKFGVGDSLVIEHGKQMHLALAFAHALVFGLVFGLGLAGDYGIFPCLVSKITTL